MGALDGGVTRQKVMLVSVCGFPERKSARFSPPAQPQAHLRWNETREDLSGRLEMDEIEIYNFPAPL